MKTQIKMVRDFWDTLYNYSVLAEDNEAYFFCNQIILLFCIFKFYFLEYENEIEKARHVEEKIHDELGKFSLHCKLRKG